MKRNLFLCGLLILLSEMMMSMETKANADEPAWMPAAAPLMTRWAKDVTPEKVRPEYPRPQMVRKDWKSLNGLWEFAFDDANVGQTEGWQTGKAFSDRILVPFTFEAALSGLGKGKEIHEHIWYRRPFEVPNSWRGKRILLHFGAVDWHTTVWVNGKKLGEHIGGYTPFSFDITDALKPGASQEVVVAVYDPADPKGAGWQPKGKQLGSEGIWYTRTTGIWQTVWLEPVHASHIERLTLQAEQDGTLQVNTHVAQGENCSLDISLWRHGQPVVLQRVDDPAGKPFNGANLQTYHISSPDLWTPETPNLYDVKLELKQNGHVVDTLDSYCAFRSVGIANGRLTLNGKPYFYRGVLDQGFWPDGIYTPPTDDAIRNDVEITKKLGFNMARKHVKVEDPRWYYWCDRLGLAVWQDMPSSHNLSTDAAKQNFIHEWTETMAAVEGHPCIVQWIPFNENWGDPKEFQDEIVTLTRKLDPSRPITDASGWTQRGLTDVIDAHDYGNNLVRHGVHNPTKPQVVGEYGGIALPISGHTWTQGWGYQTVHDPDGLLRRVRFQTSQLFEAENLSGYVYTQLTDVEQELNGLLTYDRLPKADLKQTAAIFEGKSRAIRTPAIADWLVLGPIPTGTNLTTAADDAPNRAVMAQILNKPWITDEADLRPTEKSEATVEGKPYLWTLVHTDPLDFHRIFGGMHENAVAYAVAYVDSLREVNSATLLLGSDDGATVWLNGKKIWTVARIRGVTQDNDLIPNLTLHEGRNILVVKVGQGVGG
ncbi:MAG TPA: glycoside hydrolase family 2 TIM barrel-domain containing protein, partial [Chthonomonadaceae bacterium]|nr:glycoside hydrolase family 2 TIM barrel-domain containing protein [Chthonomonadaceae bacterium]